MLIHLIEDFIGIFGLSIIIILLFNKLKLPAIIGFILAGAVLGPNALGLTKSIVEVQTLAEIGIVLLLFTIGVEFSFKSLFEMKKIVFIGGSIQVLITILVTALITMYSGYPVMLSIFIGYLVSHSSTTIMLKFFESRKEVESLYSKSGLGISIFQDMTSIPMLLSIPLIIGSSANMNQDPLSIIIKLIGLVILIYVSTKWIVPSIFYHVLKTKSREMFLITSMIICFSFALVTYEIGLSLSLGAFLAGLIISESEYSVSVKSIVLPFRDLFISLFFVSIGMLLDWNFLLNQGWTVMLFTGIVVALKFIIAFAACLLTNLKTKTSIITALALSQIGEFSFVLSKAGVEQGLFSNELNQLFLNVAIFTMCIIPLLLTLVFRIIDKRKIVIDM